MSDGWARPSGGGPPDGFVEIELTERGPPRQPSTPDVTVDGARDDRHRGRWVVVAVALVVAVAVVGSFALDGGDELATPVSTVLDPSQITTPPTLASLETVPAATVPTTVPTTVPAPVTSTPFDPDAVGLPTFEVVTGVPPGLLAAYDLATAVEANVTGADPARSTLVLEGVRTDGQIRSTALVRIEHDPSTLLDSVSIERNVGEPSQLIGDRTGRVVLRNDVSLGDKWEPFAEELFVEGTGATTVEALFDSLLSGPITESTLAASEVTPDDRLVQLPDGTFARAHRVVVPVDALRPYGLLLFANVFDDSVRAGQVPDRFEFTAYVTEQARLALVTGLFEAGGVVFAMQQTIDPRPAADVEIALPTPDELLPTAPERSP